MPWTYTFHRQAMLNRTTRILKPIAFRTRFHGETIKMLWLKRSCYDLKRSQRFHAKTSPLQWLKTKCYDLTLPLVPATKMAPTKQTWQQNDLPRICQAGARGLKFLPQTVLRSSISQIPQGSVRISLGSIGQNLSCKYQRGCICCFVQVQLSLSISSFLIRCTEQLALQCLLVFGLHCAYVHTFVLCFLSPHDLSLWYVSSLVLKPALAREAVADVSVRLPFWRAWGSASSTRFSHLFSILFTRKKGYSRFSRHPVIAQSFPISWHDLYIGDHRT